MRSLQVRIFLLDEGLNYMRSLQVRIFLLDEGLNYMRSLQVRINLLWHIFYVQFLEIILDTICDTLLYNVYHFPGSRICFYNMSP